MINMINIIMLDNKCFLAFLTVVFIIHKVFQALLVYTSVKVASAFYLGYVLIEIPYILSCVCDLITDGKEIVHNTISHW